MTVSPVATSAMRAAMLARIHATAFVPVHRWDAVAMQALLDMPGIFIVLAQEKAAGEAGHDAAGFIMARTTLDEAEILTFAVNPAWRRRGIGRDLLARCMREAADAGATTLFLEVARDNTPALALYRAAGFAQVGMRRGYYPDGMDACVMQRRI
ncbi:ribosomal protein S18-alanine N-acetyltransferase [Komagataeibacter sp. FNDCF1]|uniref:ribosomal protein S18-alanine N-acetyltransferase n=1 Tax=Komagataeibacter sp. FNDCF1 TaxID=2878681 RepID=UPI001E5C666A|nr:ribosomal protein S18-alanine N-acetyltransferase [Komagataeibacter sp. FNDCF1]MCE2565501.1 ribosomal protein S18-alanine N-acetyltransferase [Komagataeibacter sp. FNDCF1]